MKKLYTLLIITLFLGFSSNAQVVISQVYGGGGGSGATYTHDFIELFNRGSVAQDLTGWSVQYASATGTTWGVTNLGSFSLQPGQYYLVQEASTAVVGIALPTPDASGTLAMSGTNGKVILVNVTNVQTGANPAGAQIIDKVGFGTTPNGYEGTGPTGTALTNTTSAQRLNTGCTDTNNNPMDFTTGLPIPRNTATPTAVCPSTPSILISSPANAAILSPETTNVSITLSVANFNVANGTGDGHIRYAINSETAVMKYDTTPIAVPTTPGNYTVYAELVDNSNVAIVPAKNATVTFTVASYNTVNDLAALRADVTANGAGKYYQISSTPVISYARTSRNQKYIQDATAGILIDDVPATISTSMIAGDAISELKGQTSLFNGVLQLLPSKNATVASSGNTITPQVVTAADITASVETYESELVQINNASFTTADGTIVFATNTTYNLSDGSNIAFRTMFSEANYIGQVVPSGAANRVFLVAEFNGTAQVASRSLADTNLSVKQNKISGLNIYPNPVTNGTLYISSDSASAKSVEIYDILGKQVLNAKTSNNAVNVSNLKGGAYIVKITEEGKTDTRKLIIE